MSRHLSNVENKYWKILDILGDCLICDYFFQAAGEDAKTKELQEKLREANKENKDLANRNKQLEKELKAAEKSGGAGGGMDEVGASVLSRLLFVFNLTV